MSFSRYAIAHETDKIVVLSSYRLDDYRDGASMHLKDLFESIPSQYQADLLATRTSFGQNWLENAAGRNAIITCVYQLLRLYLSRRFLRGNVLLLGMHSLLFAPLVRGEFVYAPLDCWSAREARLASTSTSIREKVLRMLVSKLARGLEMRYLRKCSYIVTVSGEEVSKYSPAALKNTKFLQLPLKKIREAPVGFKRTPLSNKVLIWMDCRVGYGMQSVSLVLDMMRRLQRESGAVYEVYILSRKSNLDMAPILDVDSTNVEFVDDLAEFLQEFDCVILPDLTGSGIKNRVFDVVAARVPLVSTLAALEGIASAGNDEVAAVFQDFGSFTDAIMDLASTRTEARVEMAAKNLHDRRSETFAKFWTELNLAFSRRSI